MQGKVGLEERLKAGLGEIEEVVIQIGHIQNAPDCSINKTGVTAKRQLKDIRSELLTLIQFNNYLNFDFFNWFF